MDSGSEIWKSYEKLGELIKSVTATHAEEVKKLQTEVEQLRLDNLYKTQRIRVLKQRLVETEEELFMQKRVEELGNPVDPAITKSSLPTVISKRYDDDQCLLLEKLPEVVWRLVLERASGPTLEACLEASDSFHPLIESGDSVFMWPQVVPSVMSARVNVAEHHLVSEQTLQILLNLKLRLRIATFSVQSNCSKILNEFLAAQRDNLEKFHISTLEVPSDPLVLEFPEMKRLRDLKILTGESVWKSDNIFTIRQQIYDVIPALQSLTLSVGNSVQWDVFLPTSGHTRRHSNRKTCQTVRTFTLIDWLSPQPFSCGNTLANGLWLFPNLVSVEVPVLIGCRSLFDIAAKNCGNLRKLTLTRDLKATCRHSFDTFITGYSKQVCAEILENPGADPEEIQSRIQGETHPNITKLQKLEFLRIIHGNTCGPTNVSCIFFLKLKSLKILQFPDQLPKHITNEMVQQMERQFTVLCK